MMVGLQPEKPCNRCKKVSALHKLRHETVCRDCFVGYVDAKVIKRLGALLRDIRTSQAPESRRYLTGLSFGQSSAALLQVLDSYRAYQASKKSSSSVEVLAIHVDTDLSCPGEVTETPAQRLLAKYREKYPNISLECVHLTKVLEVQTVDWSALPALRGATDLERLRNLFDNLPSVTSKADILRLFIRHILLNAAIENSSKVLLFGHTTTSLAALTLAEVANGRGFAVPWQVNDGPFTICTYDTTPEAAGKEVARSEFPVYYPMREVFKNELATYVDLTPSLKELVQTGTSATDNVVSHKDLSIEEVMTRYFSNVEGPYSGIVSNVVRTAGKLDRVASGRNCHMCSATLDEQGDSRWAGEMGDDPSDGSASASRGRLCYGCIRSIHG
ncbi:Thiouridylase subunit 2 [Stachybotrys elegans]|uniref:Cytoplasmic tRNA 2-thiolation protein 2 n=1 Tax=Stachybotrys elegans TaxID=80388 RepID=A0A8K0SN91_9HYPO|nr:Thiouridylase subunit 2 [Stachybotrys elegans]